LLRFILCPRRNGICLVNTCLDTFCVFAGIGQVSSTHAEIHLSSLAWHVFSQEILRCMLCPCWNGRDLVNKCLDVFCILAGMGWFWSTHVEIDSVSSLAWDAFGQHMLRYILCSRLDGMGLYSTN
jgi:hypothetical protein